MNAGGFSPINFGATPRVNQFSPTSGPAAKPADGETFVTSGADWKPTGKPTFAATESVGEVKRNAGHTKSLFAGLTLALGVALCSGCASTGALHGAANESLHPQQTSQQAAPAKGNQAYQAGKEVHEAVKPALKKGKEIGLEIGKQGKKAGLEIADQAVEFGHGVRDFFKGVVGK